MILNIHTSLFYQAWRIWPGVVVLFFCPCLSQVSAEESAKGHLKASCFYTPWFELEKYQGEHACQLKTLRFWPQFYLRTLSPQYYEAKVYALADQAQGRLMNMDLEDVFELLPEKVPLQIAHLCLKGAHKDEQLFQVQLKSYQHKTEQPVNLGDFIFYFGLQKENSSRKQYFPDLHVEVNMGNHSLKLMHNLWHSNVKILSHMDGPMLLKALREDFPTVMNMLERYLTIVLDVQGGAIKTFTLNLKINRESLRAHYPKIEKYLWRLSDLIWGKVVLFDQGGNEWGQFELDTQTLTFKSKFFLGEEGLFYLNSKLDKAWKWGEDIFNGYLLADLTMKVQGVRPLIQGHKIPFSYRPNLKMDQVEFLGGEKPKVKVESNAFTFLPVTIAKVFMGLESDIHRFFTEMGQTRDGGKGKLAITLTETIMADAKSRTLLSMDGKSKISNNLFIKLGFQMLAFRLMPDSETKDEWRRWWSELLNLALNDIHTYTTFCEGKTHEKN